jgi:hypothetical protein
VGAAYRRTAADWSASRPAWGPPRDRRAIQPVGDDGGGADLRVQVVQRLPERAGQLGARVGAHPLDRRQQLGEDVDRAAVAHDRAGSPLGVRRPPHPALRVGGPPHPLAGRRRQPPAPSGRGPDEPEVREPRHGPRAPRPAHGVRRVRVERGLERRQREEGLAGGGVEQLPRRLEARPERRVAGRAVPAAVGRGREPPVEARHEVGRLHPASVGREQLDRQRQAVQPGQERRDGPRLEAPAGAVLEERPRVVVAERLEPHHPLPRDRQRRPARHDDAELRSRRTPRRDLGGDRAREGLGVVQHQDGRGPPQRGHQVLRIRQPERPRHEARQRERLGDPRELDPLGGGAAGQLLREAGLAHAAGAADGHQARAAGEEQVQRVGAADPRVAGRGDRAGRGAAA